jgi:Flp pilus assembly protein TadD
MLKTVLSELRRSLSRKAATTGPVVDPLETWRSAFGGASSEERLSLLARLDAAIEAAPERKQGWTLRGDWRLRLGRLAEAEQDYRRSLQIDPMSPSAHEGLGLVLLQARRLEEAYLHFELAHKIQPMNADILTHWGLVALEMGNLSDAHTKFERAVERDARNPHARHNLGLVEAKRGRPEQGIEYLRRAIELKPDHGLAHSNIALAYRDAEQLEQAVAAAHRAAELKPDNARVWVVLGDVLVDAGRLEEAHQALQQAAKLAPQSAAPQIALGKLFTACGRLAEGELAYRSALTVSPGDPEAEGGLGQLELLQGHFAAGWDAYEARKRAASAPVRTFPFSEWAGEDLTGRTILVHAEQGLGDIILFASCLPAVIARAGHVVVETHPKLARLFTRSFPSATIVGRDVGEPCLDWLHGLPAIERQISIGSLPRLLRRASPDFPPHDGYLHVDESSVEAWRERLAKIGPGPTIGIAWRGGLVRSGGTQRSLALELLLTALQPIGARLVSLQYGDVGAEVAAARLKCGIAIEHHPEALVDQADAAALTCAVDAVVTVCSTQAHLTGALGQPGCVLVPANPNWRYGAIGSSMPWYPSLYLARQNQLGDWSSALTAARAWLSGRLPR